MDELAQFVQKSDPKHARKRPRDKSSWKCEVARKKRYEAKKLPEFPQCGHSQKAFCCTRLTCQDIRRFHKFFYKCTTKLKQDNFFSGHMPLRKFAYLLGKVTSPNCKTCDKPEDVYHVLVECVRNQAERQLVLQELNINVVDVGAFHQILAYPNTREARLLFDLANCAGSSGNLPS